ncbi:MAG: NADH-quinone oxidoreductase subunit L [Chloroflexi bacterium]|nr:NADH-quinone oxidoreductase subunit L [Chloroflexota bacterium]
MTPGLAWLIFFLPLISFGIIALILRPFFNDRPRLSGYLTIASIASSLGISLWLLSTVASEPGRRLVTEPVEWMSIGNLTVTMGLNLDALTAIMAVVVTSVSLLVQFYSQAYMKDDPGYHRYFAFMSLFTASMLGLILADNLLMLYAFWELVGLCSYLLIGFWFHRPTAAAAAKKAFIVTRLGDFGFLMAILLLYSQRHTFQISELLTNETAVALAGASFLGMNLLIWAALGIFSGAVGKSAQFPLHTWLPDAMEGPTPVSALIHAATMVAAGVYLVARMFPLFHHPEAEAALTAVAVVGAFTALFAATMGVVANDIKRVMAYSTISQLGYMMLGLGTGSLAAGIFHLFNHAFFKALLFLSAGSVNHATGPFVMRYMGGLRRLMPWTFSVMLVAGLSLAGIWPFSGFWSKDEVLAHALKERPILFVLAMVTVFLTAFYIMRAMFMTFGGTYRGGAEAAGEHGAHKATHPHESPWVMLGPMLILAGLAIMSGWFNLEGRFSAFLGEEAETHGFFGSLGQPLALGSLAVAAGGILLAYAMYSARWIKPEAVGRALAPLYTLTSRKYYFDELYEKIFVVRFLLNGVFAVLQFFDSYVVDGIVNVVGWLSLTLGRGLRRLQMGQVQGYGLAIFLGVLAIMGAFYMWGR